MPFTITLLVIFSMILLAGTNAMCYFLHLKAQEKFLNALKVQTDMGYTALLSRSAKERVDVEIRAEAAQRQLLELEDEISKSVEGQLKTTPPALIVHNAETGEEIFLDSLKWDY